jgi:Zn-dependent protease with chaperone function
MPHRFITRFFAIALAVGCAALAPPARADEGERKIGQRMYDGFNKRNEIETGTPYNAMLEPVADRVIAAAQPLYDEPFHVYVLKGNTVNAFAAPGGFMFVYQGLLDTVRTKDELAGVLCHEMSHVIHHDGVNLAKQARQRAIGFGIAGLLVPGVGALAVDLLKDASNFQMAHFSRKVETDADITGSDICVQAGYNPYGMVWVMEDLQKLAGHRGNLEMLSDHPRDDHRIADLDTHFKDKPATFSAFADEPSYAVPVAATSSGIIHATLPLVVCARDGNADGSDEQFTTWHQAAAAFSSAFAGTPPALAPPAMPETPVTAAAPAPTSAQPSLIFAAASVTDPPALDPASDSATAFPLRTWFAAKERAGGSAVEYDKTTRTLASCTVTPAFSSFEVETDVDAPPFKVATLDPQKLAAATGLRVGIPIDDVLAHYGTSTPVQLDGTLVLYRWMRSSAEGSTARVSVIAKDGRAIAFRRETTYPTKAEPPLPSFIPPVPAAPASPAPATAATATPM